MFVKNTESFELIGIINKEVSEVAYIFRGLFKVHSDQNGCREHNLRRRESQDFTHGKLQKEKGRFNFVSLVMFGRLLFDQAMFDRHFV